MPDAPVLALEGVTKSYGGAVALRGASIEVRAGEVLCLVGENGAGKSTLSAIASGVVKPDSGRILSNGEVVEFGSPRDAERVGICLAPQELNLCSNLTVAENVMLGAFPRDRWGLVDRRRLVAEAARRLERVGLTGLDLTAKTEGLSIVERTFVQIARALRADARVLIADEPTAPMSSREAERLLELIEAIKAEGIAVLYVSHRLDEVLRLGTRCVVLRDGAIVDQFATGDGSRERIVSSMIGSRRLAARTAPAPEQSDAPVLAVTNLAADGIEDASLRVAAGEIVGVYGVAGSGRETIGQAIFGSAPRTAGSVVIDGRSVKQGDVRTSIRSGIGYVPPERRSLGLLLNRSVLENLSLASLTSMRRRGFLSQTQERTRAEEWRRRLGVKYAHARMPIAGLSGGNQQKVLLERWLIANSRALVLDDPTRGVDIGARIDIYNLLRQLAYEEKLGVLVISSDIEEIASICDRVYVMRRGVVAAELRRPTQGEIAHVAHDLTKESA